MAAGCTRSLPMAIRTPKSNAALAVIVLVAVGAAVPVPSIATADDTALPWPAQVALFAPTEPSASQVAPPQAKPSNKPGPTHKPKPTPRPTPTPIRTTPRPSVVRVTPRPTAARAATPRPTAVATPASAAATDGSPGVAGPTAEPPLDLAASDNVIIPVALIAAAVVVLVLARFARRRLLPATEDGAIQVAEAPLAVLPPPPPPRRVPAQLEPTGEEHLPRWRRPSVVAARFETLNTAAIKAAAGLTRRRRPAQHFGSDAEVDRRVLRYDGVVLLDRPDDVHGRPMEGLQADDEVALLERDELWANVATPGGRAGWIPAMALGPAAAPGAEAGAGPTDASDGAASPEPADGGEPSSSHETVIDTLLANSAKGQPERT
jgi:hypothetical protein